MADSKADQYRALKERLVSFDNAVLLFETHGLRARNDEPGIFINADALVNWQANNTFRSGSPHADLGAAVKAHVKAHLAEAFAEFRVALVARIKRAHIDAANEARAIIAETPPK